MIEKTDLRIAAFGKDLRYTYVSPANGRYHDMPAREICGRHVSELIGNARYEKRAKRYFDKCFGGEDQCYYYYLDSKRHGRQLMECRMLAQRDADNDVLGAGGAHARPHQRFRRSPPLGGRKPGLTAQGLIGDVHRFTESMNLSNCLFSRNS